MYLSTITLFLTIFIVHVSSHIRIDSPPARSTDTGQKTGGQSGYDTLEDTCGRDTGIYTGVDVTDWIPGTTETILVYPQVPHEGYTFRVAIGNVLDDSGFDECILLDHIPQIDQSLNGVADQLQISVVVPNLNCENICALQVLMIQGSSNSCCDYESAGCGTIYHTCSNIRINGTIDRTNTELVDAACTQPCEWAYRDWKESYYTFPEESSTIWEFEDGSTTHLKLIVDNSHAYQTPECYDGNLDDLVASTCDVATGSPSNNPTPKPTQVGDTPKPSVSPTDNTNSPTKNPLSPTAFGETYAPTMKPTTMSPTLQPTNKIYNYEIKVDMTFIFTFNVTNNNDNGISNIVDSIIDIIEWFIKYNVWTNVNNDDTSTNRRLLYTTVVTTDDMTINIVYNYYSNDNDGSTELTLEMTIDTTNSDIASALSDYIVDNDDFETDVSTEVSSIINDGSSTISTTTDCTDCNTVDSTSLTTTQLSLSDVSTTASFTTIDPNTNDNSDNGSSNNSGIDVGDFSDYNVIEWVILIFIIIGIFFVGGLICLCYIAYDKAKSSNNSSSHYDPNGSSNKSKSNKQVQMAFGPTYGSGTATPNHGQTNITQAESDNEDNQIPTTRPGVGYGIVNTTSNFNTNNQQRPPKPPQVGGARPPPPRPHGRPPVPRKW